MSIVAEGVAFTYPGRSRTLDDVWLSVSGGETLSLLGPNGAGKTTLLRCLLGIHRPSGGRVLVNGVDAATMSRAHLARSVAYVPQSGTMVFPFSVLEVVLMGRTPHLGGLAVPSRLDEAIARKSAEQAGVAHLSARPFTEISGGERQLVLIARALCQQARILVMDEPTANLDCGNRTRILGLLNDLRASGHAIVMTAHDPDQAFVSATHAAILQGGRIVAYGAPDMVLTSESLTVLYGAPLAVARASVPGHPSVKVCIPILGGDSRMGRPGSA